MLKLLPILFALHLLLCGCSPAPVEIEYAPPAEYVDASYEDMEIYQFLSDNIIEDSSLEEILAVFAQMSKIAVDSTTDMYLYEVYSYESEGTEYLTCHIVRQVDEPNSDEFIQLSLDITYPCEDGMDQYKEVTWFERDAEGFVEYIQSGDLYKILLDKPIYGYYISIYGT